MPRSHSIRSRWMCLVMFLLTLVLNGSACSPAYREPIHFMGERPEGVTLSCQQCYDHAVRVLTGPPKHRRYKAVVRHACPDCASEAVIYNGPDGKPMIRCEQCAPEGVPCDRCLPPKRTNG